MSDATTATTTTTTATTEAAAATSESAGDAGKPAAPSPSAAEASAAGSAAAPAPAKDSDRDLELSRKFDHVARREAKTRKMEAELHKLQAQMAEREKKAAEREAELEAALEDPIDYYLRKGKDPVEVAKRFAKPMTEEEKRIKKLEDEIAKDREARTKAEKEAEERAEAAQRETTMRSFVREITPENSPHLTRLYEAREVPALVEDLLSRSVDVPGEGRMTELEYFQLQHGRMPSNEEIRISLEQEAESRARRVMELAKANRQEPTESQPHETATPPENGVSKSGPSGISNQHAAQTTSANGKRKKTREELKAELKAQLEAEAERSS